jgi:hypothetical protein
VQTLTSAGSFFESDSTFVTDGTGGITAWRVVVLLFAFPLSGWIISSFNVINTEEIGTLSNALFPNEQTGYTLTGTSTWNSSVGTSITPEPSIASLVGVGLALLGIVGILRKSVSAR